MAEPALRRIGAAFRAQRRATRKLRRRMAAVTLLFSGALLATIIWMPRPLLLWNASASAPIGLYRVGPAHDLAPGDMVAARLTPPMRDLAAGRGYLPANVPLVKRVAAVAGDQVCAIGTAIHINGRLTATRRARDRAGRVMPWWRGCVTLRAGTVLLLMDNPGSFDGRYAGTTQARDIIGRAYPLWIR